ncbi:MAG: hypothetical protein FJ403_19515 [Verrucomicrobia bacterium]|nr:hypothetical protein [Verrucomicrobiota bacterium]
MPNLLIIADDLTGANDVGVQLAKNGVRSFVTTDLEADFDKLFREFEVVVVDSESRHLSPQEAGKRISTLVDRARQAGVDRFYKKTDSTMRGNIGSELEALLASSGRATLCFVPALPQLGRTTRGGLQYVHGQPLHTTAYARDPRNPIDESSVPAILQRQCSMPITVMPLNAISECHRDNPPRGIVVFDGETDDDFRRISRAIGQIGCPDVLAGTAGFAEYLPGLSDFAKAEPSPPKYRRPMLIINGSLNDVSLRQSLHARQSGVAWKQLSPHLLMSPEGPKSSAAFACVDEIVAILNGGGDVLLQSVTQREELPCYLAAGASRESSSELHELVARNTGRIIAQIMQRTALKLLVIFGGDTLVGIADELDWPGFLPCEELVPGLTVSEVAQSEGLIVISKSGGFGPENILTNLQEILKQKVEC